MTWATLLQQLIAQFGPIIGQWLLNILQGQHGKGNAQAHALLQMPTFDWNTIKAIILPLLQAEAASLPAGLAKDSVQVLIDLINAYTPAPTIP